MLIFHHYKKCKVFDHLCDLMQNRIANFSIVSLYLKGLKWIEMTYPSMMNINVNNTECKIFFFICKVKSFSRTFYMIAISSSTEKEKLLLTIVRKLQNSKEFSIFLILFFLLVVWKSFLLFRRQQKFEWNNWTTVETITTKYFLLLCLL